MKFESHPGRPLVEHLMDVRNIGVGKVRKETKEIYEIVSTTHDFGKYTEYFQEYLKTHKKNNLTNHGFVSAVFGSFVAIERGMDNDIPLVVYSSIIHHHGNLKNISANLPISFLETKKDKFDIHLREKINSAKEQIKSIKNNQNQIYKDMETLGLAKEFHKFINDDCVESTLIKLKKIHHKITSKSQESNSYFAHHEIYSALTSSDKQSAARISIETIKQVNYEEIDGIRKNKYNKNDTKLNKIRSDIFNTVQKTLELEKLNNNIFTITSPTGTGKTITGLYAADQLRKTLGLDGHVIYVIPFTSVIDQNYKVIYDILYETTDFKGKEDTYILKHHNLSDKSYLDYEYNQAELLVEDWKSDIIVTTFVQFLESIVSNSNRMTKKYYNFRNSVILMDEIQAIDVKYYHLVEHVINKMCEMFNMKVIMMTATKPLILEKGTELLNNYTEYYEVFNRTRLVYHADTITVEEFVGKFIEKIEEDNTDKSYMIVSNTISQSMQIFNGIKDTGQVYYLSTNIIPKDRLRIIREIQQKLKKGEKLILVTTQLVEAGVDLDFDEVIRDIGPLDSIIQCAGRCNRENKQKTPGNVHIYNMIDDNEKIYGQYVYGLTSIDITRDILKDNKAIEEKKYLDIIEKYYKQIKEKKSQDESSEYIKSLNTLRFTDYDYSLDKFSLIKDNPNYISVIIEKDEIIDEALRKYKTEQDRYKRQSIGNLIKEYTLSIPMKHCINIEDYSVGINKIVRNEVLDHYYDTITGFIREDTSSIVFL